MLSVKLFKMEAGQELADDGRVHIKALHDIGWSPTEEVFKDMYRPGL